MTALLYPGKIFMYPCAGNDIAEPVQVFGELFDTFLFVDLQYHAASGIPKIPGWCEVSGSQRKLGSLISAVRHMQDGRSKFRVIEPGWFFSDHINETTGRRILLVRRRGFGQYALHELPDGSLSMFMHRGDSSGEGGSNVFYLANRRTSHGPISNLLNLLKRKITVPALIASDGSNTDISALRHSANDSEEIESFSRHGLKWRWQAVSRLLSSGTNVWEVQPEGGPKI